MMLSNIFGIFALALLVQQASSHHLSNYSALQWAKSAESSLTNAGLMFAFVQQGVGSYNKDKIPKMVEVLSKKTARIAGMLGSMGAVFAIVMAFVPSGESAELTFMKSEFGKLFQRVDAVSRSVEDTKNLIKSSTQQAAYVRYEHNIHNAYTALQQCLQQLENVSCSNDTDCYRRKVSVAQDYISSLNVRQDMNAIFRGVTTDSAFGRSLLDLLSEESKCDVPRINNLANKIVSLVTKALKVSIFHDYWTKTGYNVLDETASIETMFRQMENKRQSIQDACFKNIDNRLAVDSMDAKSDFSSDVQNTNIIVLKKMRRKYTWIDFVVLAVAGDKSPKTWSQNSPRRHFRASSKQHNMHAFVIPTNNNTVENHDVKIGEWTQLVQQVKVSDDNAVAQIERLIKDNDVLDGHIQSFAILPGTGWVMGYYNDTTIIHHTLGTYNMSLLNVFVNRPRASESVLVAVSFLQSDYPFHCSDSDSCTGNSACYVYPFSTKTGCVCKTGYSGESCETTKTNIQLQSVINSLFENTMKLPSFTSIQYELEDAQLSLTASLENIHNSVMNLGVKIDEKFQSLGDIMADKLDLISLMLKYKNAIEYVQYFHSIANMDESNLNRTFNISFINLTTSSANNLFAMKDIAKFLLNPAGIKKWLYQINYLILGRKGNELSFHEPLIYLVMDKYKDRLCFQDYKDELTRTYQQLMLLQYKGYALWGRALSTLNRDSSLVANSYAKVLAKQTEYLRRNTCSVKIKHSKSLQDCTGGFYIHKAMNITVECKDGFFCQGKFVKPLACE